MKQLALPFLLILLLFSSSCEKDDLCTPDQSASPRVVVVFVDAQNPSQAKAVSNLQITEINSTTPAPLDFDGSTLLESADTIYLPLRNLTNLTSYNFQADTESGTNIDNLDFTYTNEESYVSRACGFKVNYENLSVSRNDDLPVDDPWILSDPILINNTVTNSNEVHVEIRH